MQKNLRMQILIEFYAWRKYEEAARNWFQKRNLQLSWNLDRYQKILVCLKLSMHRKGRLWSVFSLEYDFSRASS
jgi:hypothetical protein